MYVDSHCHLSFPDLIDDRAAILARMRESKVVAALNICTTLAEFPAVLAATESEYPAIYASAGVHPDTQSAPEATVDDLVRMARHPKVVAIGETGLDYFRLNEPLEWQRERFRVHIRAARECNKPLVIHTRAASEDTIRLMREEGADRVGGVMHCFTESQAVADAALELGFLISFSGIVTFKNANDLQQVAARIPAERLLIETDAPYLAPVPHRGKRNEPAWVPFVARKLAELRQVSVEQIASATTANFCRLFRVMDDFLNVKGQKGFKPVADDSFYI